MMQDFIEENEDENFDEEDLFEIDDIDNDYQQEVMSFLPTLMTSAISLTELLVANRKHNSQKMNDEDILDIHHKAFQHINEVLGNR